MVVLMGMAFSLSALGTERFPPPEFEPGYQLPVTTLPVPRAGWMEWLDVAVLLAALGLSTWFVIKKRSRKWVMGLGIFSLAYFGFYRKGCVCAIGSIQDVAMAVFNHGYAAPLTVVAFFLLPIVFALFWGRSFCGSVCPHGAIQDLVLIKPVKIWPWLEATLRMGPFVYLGLAVLFAATGSAFIICEWDPFVGLFRLSGSVAMLCLGGAFLVVGMFVGRPYCRFVCPYGAILSWVARFSKWKVTLSPQDCIQCALCDAACPYGAIAEPAQPDVKPLGTKSAVVYAAVFLPALAALGVWLGGNLAVPFSKVHPTVALAERVAGEDAGKLVGTTDASSAFRQTGRPVAELTAQALKIRAEFALGCKIFGGFLGLALGLKLLSLSLSNPRTVYDPDAADCVSCGRCFKFCPREIARVKKAERKPELPKPSKPA
jgi:ferredoxin